MPANSKTVLIEPPAITPVPGAAGLISTLAAPSLPLDKVGIELFGVKGTLTTVSYTHLTLPTRLMV